MRRSDGFTLIEVLVAGLLLTFIVLGVATMSVTALAQLGRSGQHSSAVMLSQQRLEWLRNQDYTSTALNQGVSTELLTGEYAGYTRVTKVVTDSPRAGVKRISVVTSTPGSTSATVETLIAEP